MSTSIPAEAALPSCERSRKAMRYCTREPVKCRPEAELDEKKKKKRTYQNADERTEDEIEPAQEDLLLRGANHIAHELLVRRVLVDFLLGVTNVTFEEVAVLLDGGADVALLFGGAHRSLSKGSFGGERSRTDTNNLFLARLRSP